jgi:feruloyl esterase
MKFASVVGFLLAAPTMAAAPAPCGELRSMSVSNASIVSAELVAAAGTLPAHCRVAAVLAPSTDSHIEMQLWLPLPETWNGKFEAVGNGGWAGTITTGTANSPRIARSMASALKEGYATASNDTGHKGATASFAVGHPEKLRDFADRAVHQMTVTSKSIIAAFYGKSARLSYWNGCSTGGRQGLMAAQRHPEDFDGIVAGAPANYWTHLMAGIVWGAQAAHKDEPGNMPAEKLAVLHQAVLRACDTLDGVRDGVLTDPTRCKFDPGEIQCPGDDGPKCLTAAQVEAARKMYRGAANPRTGAQIYPGMVPGSELGWDPVNGLQPLKIAENHFQYIVFHADDWNYRKLNFDADIALTDKTDNGLINATDPNLDAFFAHGGKLIQYHGWNDQQISPVNSVNYYNSVLERMGGAKRVSESYRLFMAPGVMHCGGGEGPDQFDPMAALERWRESNVAPDRLIAVHVNNGAVETTRPLCPYPQVAVYKGIGSTNDAGNFACRTP